MVSLPLNIKGLGTLRNLIIYSCPELKKRCDKEIGEDWHKIAHIPLVRMENGVGYRNLFGGSHYGVNDCGIFKVIAIFTRLLFFSFENFLYLYGFLYIYPISIKVVVIHFLSILLLLHIHNNK